MDQTNFNVSGGYAETPEQWNAIKPHLKRLYIEEGRSLAKVQQILEEQYGFRATIKMYKIRITKWSLRKNYSPTDKFAAAAVLRAAAHAGEPVPQIRINGELIDVYRVLRHHPQKRQILGALKGHAASRSREVYREPDDQEASSLHVPTSNRGKSGPDRILYRQGLMGNALTPSVQRVVRSPPTMHAFETTLKEIEIYTEYCLKSFKNRPLLWCVTEEPGYLKEVGSEPNFMIGHVLVAFSMARRFFEVGNNRRAFLSLNQGCELIKPALRENGITVMLSFLREMECAVWSEYNGVYGPLISYIVTMAREVLGPAHPLAKILDQLRTLQHLDDLIEPAAKLLLDLGARDNQTNVTFTDPLKGELLSLLLDYGELEAAEKLCSDIISSFPGRRENLSIWQRRIGLYLGQAYQMQFRGREAEQIWLMNLKPNSEVFTSTDVLYQIHTSESLAKLYEHQNDLAKSATYWRMAAECAIDSEVKGDEETIYYLERLESVLRRQENWTEVEELREDYGHLYLAEPEEWWKDGLVAADGSFQGEFLQDEAMENGSEREESTG